MKLAWAIRKTGQTFSEAIRRAWASMRVKKQPGGAAISFCYTKENGEKRHAIAQNELAPPAPERQVEKPKKADSPLVIKYYDMLATGWRSFRADRLILN